MPKRVIDFDAMWGSDKLAACAEWAQAEYAWLYGLADASGCFELTNLRVIWGRVAAIRKNLSVERLDQILKEFQDKGLLFVWEHEGKRYGHWTGSDVPGRLPPPSWRMRLERFAPPVPKQQLAEYTSRFARGRASFAGTGYARWAKAGGATENTALKGRVEEDQGQDLELDWNQEQKGGSAPEGTRGSARAGTASSQRAFHFSNHVSSVSNVASDSAGDATPQQPDGVAGTQRAELTRSFAARRSSQGAARFPLTEKELALARDLRAGQGPVCGPGMVKPEALERARQRAASRAP